MGDEYGAVLAMAMMAVVVMLVVGAGTSLVYVAETRRRDASRRPRAVEPHADASAQPSSSGRPSERLDRAA